MLYIILRIYSAELYSKLHRNYETLKYNYTQPNKYANTGNFCAKVPGRHFSPYNTACKINEISLAAHYSIRFTTFALTLLYIRENLD